MGNHANKRTPNSTRAITMDNRRVNNEIMDDNDRQTGEQSNQSTKKKVIIIGDSLLKFAGEQCKNEGYQVFCYPGIRVEELKHKVELMNIKSNPPDIIVIHVGTNNIRNGVYAEDIMGDTMDLVDYIKSQVPSSKIIISGILYRYDVTKQQISRINEELDWLCSVRNSTIIHGNSWIQDNDFAWDGVHLNRRGAYKLGRLINNAIRSIIKQGNK